MVFRRPTLYSWWKHIWTPIILQHARAYCKRRWTITSFTLQWEKAIVRRLGKYVSSKSIFKTRLNIKHAMLIELSILHALFTTTGWIMTWQNLAWSSINTARHAPCTYATCMCTRMLQTKVRQRILTNLKISWTHTLTHVTLVTIIARKYALWATLIAILILVRYGWRGLKKSWTCSQRCKTPWLISDGQMPRSASWKLNNSTGLLPPETRKV